MLPLHRESASYEETFILRLGLEMEEIPIRPGLILSLREEDTDKGEPIGLVKSDLMNPKNNQHPTFIITDLPHWYGNLKKHLFKSGLDYGATYTVYDREFSEHSRYLIFVMAQDCRNSLHCDKLVDFRTLVQCVRISQQTKKQCLVDFNGQIYSANRL
jgi:tRNA intron endonuclease, catalytic C-terminal domain